MRSGTQQGVEGGGRGVKEGGVKGGGEGRTGFRSFQRRGFAGGASVSRGEGWRGVYRVLGRTGQGKSGQLGLGVSRGSGWYRGSRGARQGEKRGGEEEGHVQSCEAYIHKAQVEGGGVPRRLTQDCSSLSSESPAAPLPLSTHIHSRSHTHHCSACLSLLLVLLNPRLALNPADDDAFLKVLNVPAGRLGQKLIDLLQQHQQDAVAAHSDLDMQQQQQQQQRGPQQQQRQQQQPLHLFGIAQQLLRRGVVSTAHRKGLQGFVSIIQGLSAAAVGAAVPELIVQVGEGVPGFAGFIKARKRKQKEKQHKGAAEAKGKEAGQKEGGDGKEEEGKEADGEDGGSQQHDPSAAAAGGGSSGGGGGSTPAKGKAAGKGQQQQQEPSESTATAATAAAGGGGSDGDESSEIEDDSSDDDFDDLG